MEALILSCSTGGGHNSAGQAVAEELERRGHKAVFMDPYQLAGKNTASNIGNFYIKTVQKMPRFFGFIYNLGEIYRTLPFRSPIYFLNGKMVPAMNEFLKNNHFDVVVMPHLYPAEIMTRMKDAGLETPKTVFVATDYRCIPFTEETNCDYYVTPTKRLAFDFLNRKIPEEKLLHFGIPVRNEFKKQISKEELKRSLGFDVGEKLILLSGGSMGAGKIGVSVKILSEYIKENEGYSLVIICGNNKKLYDRLSEKYQGNEKIRLVETTPKMEDYMRASEVFISKPGGLSSTEAAVSNVPFIHISPIPGCESYNAEFFSENKMSLAVKNPKRELVSALEKLKDNEFSSEMKKAQREIINKNSTDDLCDFLERIVQ